LQANDPQERRAGLVNIPRVRINFFGAQSGRERLREGMSKVNFFG